MLILNGDGVFILKNGHSICKPDTVLFEVGLCFVGIPLIIHQNLLYAQMYTGTRAIPLPRVRMWTGQ